MGRYTPVAEKRYLTTGDIAEMCDVNYRTVIRWVETGHLKAFQLPGGRGDRRVLPEDFVAFLDQNGMPLPKELRPPEKAVLVVDDDQDMAKAIQRTLKRAGFEVLVATDGFVAGALAATFKPAVITLDLKMPGLGGLAILKAIRNTPDMETRILVVSAMPAEELAEARAAGADDVLEKPFKNADLVAKVATLAEVEKPPRVAMRTRQGQA